MLRQLRLPLKLFLALLVIVIGLYLASPLWLPKILASQLPPGWHLEKLKMSWPGWSGITLQHLSVKGELPGLNVRLHAEESHVTYKGLETQIDSLVVDVFLPSKNDQPTKPFTLDDLALPVLHLSAALPQLNIKAIQLALHLSGTISQASGTTGQPIVLALQGFKLSPDESGGYHVNTAASIVGYPDVNGQFGIDVTTDKLAADIRFPADAASPAWLNLSLLQKTGLPTSGSDIHALFDSGVAGQQWLDDLLSKSTAGKLTHVGGKLEAHARFSGSDSHEIQHLTISGRQLKLELDGDSLSVNATVNADRQAQMIKLTLPTEATMELHDDSGNLNAVFITTIPGLSRANSPAGNLMLRLADNSELIIDSPDGTQPVTALHFGGDFNVDYSTDSAGIKVAAHNISIGLADVGQLQNVDLAGAVNLGWTENQPFAYVSDAIDLKAQSLDFAASGDLKMSPDSFSFEPEGPLDARLPKLQLKIQTGTSTEPAWVNLQADVFSTEKAKLSFALTGSGPDERLEYVFKGPLQANNVKISVFSSAQPPATIITATDLALTATLDSRKDRLTSMGNGYLTMVHIEPLAASANKAEFKWSNLDLLALTGKLSAKTQGFKVNIKEQPWSGFDFDLDLSLLAADAIKGEGRFLFAGGPGLPVSFDGNSGTGRWDITINNSTVPLSSLRSVLNSAHFELPAKIKLTDGSIDVAGSIEVHDEISAKVNLSGSNIAGAMAESSARKASFKFNSGYQHDIFVSGPLDVESMTLAGGIDVTNLHTDLDVQNSQAFDLSNLSADLFGGQLKLDKLSFSSGTIADTAIHINHIDLQKLLAYLDVNGLTGTGDIDFVLPAGSNADSIHISDGTFTSIGPGKLAYSSGGAVSTNIGLHALDNFHYKKLSGTIAYDTKGPYQISIRLEGSNPDLYNGYPLVFNLNISGSLPELFEAMFMTGSFDESILKQIKIK